MIMQCIQNHDTAPGGLRDRQFDDVDHGDHSQARGTRECTHSMRCPHAGTVQVHAVWTCMKQACACIACTMLHRPRSVRMLRSSVSPTAHVSHACSCAAPKFRRIQRQFLRSALGSSCASRSGQAQLVALSGPYHARTHSASSPSHRPPLFESRVRAT